MWCKRRRQRIREGRDDPPPPPPPPSQPPMQSSSTSDSRPTSRPQSPTVSPSEILSQLGKQYKDPGLLRQKLEELAPQLDPAIRGLVEGLLAVFAGRSVSAAASTAPAGSKMEKIIQQLIEQHHQQQQPVAPQLQAATKKVSPGQQPLISSTTNAASVAPLPAIAGPGDPWMMAAPVPPAVVPVPPADPSYYPNMPQSIIPSISDSAAGFQMEQMNPHTEAIDESGGEEYYNQEYYEPVGADYGGGAAYVDNGNPYGAPVWHQPMPYPTAPPPAVGMMESPMLPRFPGGPPPPGQPLQPPFGFHGGPRIPVVGRPMRGMRPIRPPRFPRVPPPMGYPPW